MKCASVSVATPLVVQQPGPQLYLNEGNGVEGNVEERVVEVGEDIEGDVVQAEAFHAVGQQAEVLC